MIYNFTKKKDDITIVVFLQNDKISTDMQIYNDKLQNITEKLKKLFGHGFVVNPKVLI